MIRPTLFGLAAVCSLAVASGTASAQEAPAQPPIAAYTTWVTSVAFSPDGATLVTGGGQTLMYRPGEVRLWDVATGAEKSAITAFDSTVWDVAVAPNGGLL